MSLFITYVNKPFTIIERHLPDGYAYADDTRLYLSFKPDRKQDQAAALGTSLFITYVNKLSTIIERHLPDGCAYADDTQLYLSFKPDRKQDQAAALGTSLYYLCEQAVHHNRKTPA